MSRKLPPLKSIHVFESVARHLSFRRAADELHVTHSAVSHQIKLLEEELTVVLFNRNGRTISLTKDGTYLYPVVRESLYNLEEAAQHLRSSNKHKTLIGDDAFIGSDSQLVAPVEIGPGATIGAGSTLTGNAPAGKLTLSRSKQVTRDNWQRPQKKDRVK